MCCCVYSPVFFRGGFGIFLFWGNVLHPGPSLSLRVFECSSFRFMEGGLKLQPPGLSELLISIFLEVDVQS